MDISRDILSKKRIIWDRLEKAGFTEREYSERFMGGDLTCVITAHPDGKVTAEAVDSGSGEEYLPMNIEAYTGSYVGQAREEYRAILERVSSECFTDMPFMSDQANRICRRIHDELKEDPDYPFSGGSKDAAVFRHERTGKWFAIVMNVKKSVLDKGSSDEMTDVMNVKIDPDSREELLKEPGLYICYHMNKKMWISIALDGSCPDDRVMELVKDSFELTEGGSAARRGSLDREKRYWLIPSDPSHFDVAKGFRDSGNDTLAWHHRIDARPGDIVYIYQTEPVASIMFECEVLESYLPRPKSWTMIAPSSKYRMTLKLIRSFKKGEYPRSWMNEHGVAKTVRGQRSAPAELAEALSDFSHDRV